MITLPFINHIQLNQELPSRFIYVLLILSFVGLPGCSRHQTAISTAELRSYLQPLTTVGDYAGFDSTKNVLYMGNRWIERWIDLNSIQTIRYTYKPSGQNYVNAPNEEFRFRVGNIVFSGNSVELTYNSHRIEQRFGVRRIEIQLIHISQSPIFHLTINYEISPDLPVILKWLTIQNLTDSAFFVEDIEIESLSFVGESGIYPQIWRGGLTQEQPETWAGGSSEPFVIVQHGNIEGGIVLGNESPGILKHYRVYSDRNTISIALKPTTDVNGAEIRVPPKETINTPKVWTMLFQGNAQTEAIEKLRSFVAAPLLTAKELTSQYTYTRWTQINPDNSVSTQKSNGNLIMVDYDWNINNLPGLKQMSKHVHDDGGKFGIRIPLAEINKAFLNKPAWQLNTTPEINRTPKNRQHKMEGSNQERVSIGRTAESEGKPDERTQLTQSEDSENHTAIYCILSGYGNYLMQAVKALLQETRADVLIFDRPVLGAGGSTLKGCGVFGHAHYSRRESIGGMYRWIFEFADYLHQEFPHLQIGITAIAYGVERPDTACFAHFDLFFK